MKKHVEKMEYAEYDKVFTYDHLLNSFYQCRKGKRYRKTVIDFETKLPRNIRKLFVRLKNREYRIGNLYSFTIREPKKRDIVANQFVDKIVQRTICDYMLQPLIAHKLIYDNYASQPGKGTDLARNRLEHFLRKYFLTFHTNDGYVLRCDVKSYFASIDRETLYSMVDKLPMDQDCKNIIRMQIYAYEPEEDAGVCIGFQTMQWMAVYYLDSLDRFIKENLKIKFYGRYMDDFYLIHPDKDYLVYCYAEIEKFLRDKLKLKLNPKSGIFHISNNMNWLGFYYRLTKEGRVIVKLTKQSVKRFVRRIKKYRKMYENDKISLYSIYCSVVSWRAHAAKCTKSGKIIKYINEKFDEVFGDIIWDDDFSDKKDNGEGN